jgi:hypothetical protein
MQRQVLCACIFWLYLSRELQFDHTDSRCVPQQHINMVRLTRQASGHWRACVVESREAVSPAAAADCCIDAAVREGAVAHR